jgi:hypothetical protein
VDALADFADGPSEASPEGDGNALVSYVMDRVTQWRIFRDGNYKDKWEAYAAIYRGEWNPKLKHKTAERSRIVTPATTNAVDQSVSEMAEAIFGRGKWFSVDEDGKPEQEVQQAEILRDQLQDDLTKRGIRGAIIGALNHGAVYGTGIMKRIVDEEEEVTAVAADPQSGAPKAQQTKVDFVQWEPIPPFNFVIDSSATSVKDAHGVAHETLRPKHEIFRKQAIGVYRKGDIGGSASGYGSTDILHGPNGENYEKDPRDGVYFTEYHGLVPRKLLEEATRAPEKPDPLDVISEDDEDPNVKEGSSTLDETDLVEAIVAIANGSTLLRAVENPILNHDRGFIAYQHFVVPNRFWGMGVVEKAYNSQSALDAEIRARMDTLALVTYPSITADATRLPRNLDLTVVPGKVFRTNGRGSEIIEPLKFGNLDPVTFQHSADLERYVQMATGAGDPSTPVNINRSAQATASGNSMQFGSYIKRAKLPMQTVDENLLDPLVRKSLLAYMTIDPDRYPALFDYTVNSTLSIMAREFEQMQLTNLMALLPQGSPEYSTVLKAIITNYSGPSKDQLLSDIEKAQQPNPMQQQAQQIQMQTAGATLQKLQEEINEIKARTQYTQSKIGTDQKKLSLQSDQIHVEAAQTLVGRQKNQIAQRQLAVQHHGNILGALAKVHATHTQAQTARMKPAKAAAQ